MPIRCPNPGAYLCSMTILRSTTIASALAIVAVSGCHSPSASPLRSTAPDSMAIRRDIEYLASPALAGRLTGTPGNDSAAAYIARRFRSLGLRPLSPEYEQHFN